MNSRDTLTLSVLAVSVATGLAAATFFPADSLATPRFDKQVSPTGEVIDGPDQYRFAEYRGEMLYGPYIVEGDRYYYQDGQVLNSRLEKTTSKKVQGLHSFYLQTYLDPLFYAPADDPGQFNLSGFERFEKYKILAEYCDLEYDLIPQEYFNDLERNHDATNSFLRKASLENAEKLVEQNRETVNGYSVFVGDFIDALNLDVSQNRCFDNETMNLGIARATRTPTQYRIDTEVMLNYVRMANNNTEKAQEEVNAREQMLDSGNRFNITIESFELKNISYSFVGTYSREGARDEMNVRRESELNELNRTEEDEEAEDGGEEAQQEDHPDEHFEGEEANHTHTEEEDNETSTNATLTPEQRSELRLVKRLPVEYDLDPYCLERDVVPVFGWDMNVYPNIILGQRDVLFQQNKKYLQDFFTVCRCPYVEITRLNWYVTDSLYQKIDQNPVSPGYSGPLSEKLGRAEAIFLNDPGRESLSQLSDTYDEALRKSLKNGEYTAALPVMWKRSQQERSRLQSFKTTYDDFFNDYHMDVWQDYFPPPDPELDRTRYNYFLLTESEYALTFMTWSDSVWRLDDKPEKFSGVLQRSNRTGTLPAPEF